MFSEGEKYIDAFLSVWFRQVEESIRYQSIGTFIGKDEPIEYRIFRAFATMIEGYGEGLLVFVVRDRSVRIGIRGHMKEYVRNDFQDVSPVKVFAVKTVLDVLLEYINEQGILNNMRIFSPYHFKGSLGTATLRASYWQMTNEREAEFTVLETCVDTVPSFQCVKNDIIICPAGLGSADTQKLGDQI